jgi:hypothetical protein
MKPVFLTREKDGCCDVCNPVRLAALECDVVTVKPPTAAAMQLSFCGRCIRALAASAKGARRVTITLHGDVQALALGTGRKKKVG